MKMTGKEYRLKRHYLPLGILVLIAVSVFYLERGKRDTIASVAQSTGYISLFLISVSLIIGTIYLLVQNKSPVSTYFRRDLSIVAGILAILHSAVGLFVHLRGKPWLYFLEKSAEGYKIRVDNFGKANYTGLTAALIILLLLATSNDYIFKRLNPSRWKRIQRLSYLMFVLTMIHAYYYWIGGKNMDLVYWFYIPLIVIVFIAQAAGILLRTIKFRDRH